MKHVNDSLEYWLCHDSYHDSIDFQRQWLNGGNITLAHEAAHQAIVQRSGILRDVSGMMHVLKAIVAVDGR